MVNIKSIYQSIIILNPNDRENNQSIGQQIIMTLKQIHASEQIMRIAINGQNHVDSLIGYYRDCIDRFNDQRAQWSVYYEACKDNVGNRHLLERELNSLMNSNIDMQSALSGIKGELTYERQRYFHKLEQSQQLKNTLEENKKRLRELTDMCRPLLATTGNNVNNIKQRQSKASFSKSSSSHQQQQSQKSIFKNERLSTKHHPHHPQQLQSNSMLTQLELKMINLSKEHEQKKMRLQGVIDELKEELEDIVGEHGQRREQCSYEYKLALDRLAQLQAKHHNLVSQFFKYRMVGIQHQQQTQQQNQIMRLKNLYLAQKLKQLQQSHSLQLNTVQSQVKQHNKQFKSRYDEQLRKKQQHLSILKQQHERIADVYLNKLKKLQAELRSTLEKTRTIEEKTRTEVSSLRSQIKILTNRLDNVALNQMKTDLMPNNAGNDDDSQSEQGSSVTLEMEELDRINKEVKQLEKEIDAGKK